MVKSMAGWLDSGVTVRQHYYSAYLNSCYSPTLPADSLLPVNLIQWQEI